MRKNRILMYVILMVVGLGLFFGGIQTYVAEAHQQEISDAAIKERARELGMVELKDALEKKSSEELQ